MTGIEPLRPPDRCPNAAPVSRLTKDVVSPPSCNPPRRGMAHRIPQLRHLKRYQCPFGSKADISQCNRHVRFAPNSDRKSRHLPKAMSALPPKADMCSALADVRFGPKSGHRTIKQRDRLAAVSPKLQFVFSLRGQCCRFLFSAPAKQTQRAEAGGEEWESGGERDGGDHRCEGEASTRA